MKIGRKVKRAGCSVLAFVIISIAVFSLYERISSFSGKEDAALMAAALTMSKGNYRINTTEKNSSAKRKTENKKQEKSPIPAKQEKTSSFSEKYYNTFSSHDNKKKYPIYEKQYRVGGKRYENFYVKNYTDYNLDIGKTLNSNLGFSLDKSDDVQVLIYHTHTSESFIDCDVGYYYSDYYPRTVDTRYNITQVGDAIEEQLKKAGIGVVHDRTSHDVLYTGSYIRSRKTVERNLKKYPNIKVTLDIHRDSIGDEGYKIKPTFTYKGKKGAQIMILSGYDPNGYYNFPKWNYNLRFAMKLQKQCETNYKGMTRPLDFGNFSYNMNVNTGSLLIEVGTEGNTLEEAVYSGKLLGKALSQVLQNS